MSQKTIFLSPSSDSFYTQEGRGPWPIAKKDHAGGWLTVALNGRLLGGGAQCGADPQGKQAARAHTCPGAISRELWGRCLHVLVLLLLHLVLTWQCSESAARAPGHRGQEQVCSHLSPKVLWEDLRLLLLHGEGAAWGQWGGGRVCGPHQSTPQGWGLFPGDKGVLVDLAPTKVTNKWIFSFTPQPPLLK